MHGWNTIAALFAYMNVCARGHGNGPQSNTDSENSFSVSFLYEVHEKG